ncbi:MAG: 4-hydroxy-tetrahydrodipicolinate reductase [Nitrospina sp.]|nr:4-hydroxy-tetrahydrodipicolinate reductase [Nitrospina sp.]MBT6601338.1 4-hydroxy-tetrahydrodipicolinate reductase [Nitrospina sp.]
MIKIVVIGAGGRMGKTIVACAEDTDGVSITGGTEYSGHSAIGSDLGVLAGIGKKNIFIVENIKDALRDCDVIIDFTTPESSIKTLKAAVSYEKSIVIGTTGFSSEQKKIISQAAEKIRCVFAPNMSIGINVLFKIVEDVSKVLGDAYDIEIVEAHHKFKKDAPSGTAVRLSEIIADSLDRDINQVGVYGRQGIAERTSKEIGVHTVRAGDIVGEHKVLYGGMGETIELFHRAQSRETFARGSLRAAKWVVNQPLGLYDMQDVLGLR